ncbi:hypothetical protein ABZ924_24315 [Streptomyces sp. NPDC046876]|uniref:hypothetical protein n=1 Tax=Streptomyces sp. NPDC046876 TaxID=3155616 RepID=UPI0033F55345
MSNMSNNNANNSANNSNNNASNNNSLAVNENTDYTANEMNAPRLQSVVPADLEAIMNDINNSNNANNNAMSNNNTMNNNNPNA